MEAAGSSPLHATHLGCLDQGVEERCDLGATLRFAAIVTLPTGGPAASSLSGVAKDCQGGIDKRSYENVRGFPYGRFGTGRTAFF